MLMKENADIKFYHTALKEKVPFTPLEGKKVKMYTCGPTVYHFAHIGNFRTYVFEDLLRRTLKAFGYHVEQVMNITDVDDKTIRGALAKGVTLKEFVAPYTQAFFDDLKSLMIEKVEHNPKATDYIPQMIEMIQRLIKKGVAYEGNDGSVYYSISKFPKYGALSHLKLDELKAGASERVNADEYDKETVSDFVLWKGLDKERDGDIYWESPFGPGRPGWHLECSAMATSLLGDSIDIHCGAVDNIFPHHENEIAQSEACTGKTFVKYWLHSEHLIVDGKKMSKSLGNFYTLRDLLQKGYTGREIRYLLLSVHYKTQLNFTIQGLEAARHALQRLDDFVQRLQKLDQRDGIDVTERLKSADAHFMAALADDLGIAQALSTLFDLIRDVNSLIDSQRLGNGEPILALLRKWNEILGVIQFEFTLAIPKEIQEALVQRNLARTQKNWKEADRLRDLIHHAGFVIEDSPTGPFLKKLSQPL